MVTEGLNPRLTVLSGRPALKGWLTFSRHAVARSVLPHDSSNLQDLSSFLLHFQIITHQTFHWHGEERGDLEDQLGGGFALPILHPADLGIACLQKIGQLFHT